MKSKTSCAPKALLIVCAWLLAAGSLFAANKVIYVNPASSTTLSLNGKSWERAYHTIDAALFEAEKTASAAQPVEIWIAGGIYRTVERGGTATDGFRLISHVWLRGAFAGTETNADQRTGAISTVLTADVGTPMVGAVTNVDQFPVRDAKVGDSGWNDNVSNVLVGERVTGVVLEGLTITGGSAMASVASIPQLDVDGMGMFAAPSTDTEDDDDEGGEEENDVPDNPNLATTVVPLSRKVAGGGLFFTAPERTDDSLDPDLSIIACRFVRNQARGYGGAILIRDAIVEMSRSSISDNRSDLNGGAISALNCRIYADRTDFSGNFALEAGGAVEISAFPTLKSMQEEAGQPDSGPGSEQDEIRKSVSYAITAVMAIKKAVAVAQTPGGVGARVRTALPTNPFGANMSIGGRLFAAYTLFTIGVTIGDQGVALAKIFGVDPNDQHVKNWESFSYNFNTYGTPAGWISLGMDALLDEILGSDRNDTSYDPANMTRTAWKRLGLDTFNKSAPSYFVQCRFLSNETKGEGGAIFNIYSNIWVENGWFGANSAETTGGAISSGGYTTPRVFSSVFWGNQSKNGHSAMSNADHSRGQVLNCTFYQNTSENDFGYALSAERGSNVRVANSVFWGNVNSLAANASGGADLLAATRATLDDETKAHYDQAGGDKVDWVGTMQLRNCNVQSLARLPAGAAMIMPFDIFPNTTVKGPREIDKWVNNYHFLDARGDTELGGITSSGEGFRVDTFDASQGNFSSNPGFLLGTVSPGPNSPLIDKGNDPYLYESVFNNFFATPKSDINNRPRRVGASVDVGAVEAQAEVLAEMEPAQPGNPDWTGRRVYVKTAATGDGSGSSWANATDKLAVAMNSLAAEVFVAAGTYKPAVTNRDLAFILANGTRVYGGFTNEENTNRDWRAHPTIISGNIGSPNSKFDNSKHLVTCSDVDSSAKLDGIIFEGAYAVDDENTDDYSDGGAVAALRSNPTITNCIFRDNSARKGAAVWSHLANLRGPTITGGEFTNNTATESGGALYYDTSLWVTDSRFFGNTAKSGGAIASTAGSFTIVQQSLFWGNSATRGFGGAILAGTDSLTVVSSTIYGNSSYTAEAGKMAGGGGIFYAAATPASARLSMSNVILTANSATSISGAGNPSAETNQLLIGSSEALSIDHSIIQGLNRYVGLAGNVNFDADPQFVAASNTQGANFQLAGNSPAINAGRTGEYSLPQDLASATRVQNGTVDVGPYEFAGSVPTAGTVVATRSGATGQVVTTFAVTPPSGSTGLQWQVDTGNGQWVNVSAGGIYSITGTTLTITGPDASANGYRYRLAYSVPGFAGLTYYSPVSRLKVGAPLIYVKANASGAKDGSSWANAYSSLRDAIDAAEAGSEIWVAAGTYYPTRAGYPADSSAFLSLHSGVAIYGGFAGTEWDINQRDYRTNVTIISGKLSAISGDATTPNSERIFFNNGQVLSGACDRTAILDGFTITGASAQGVYNDTASPTIRNCVFKLNVGSAITNWRGSNALIGNCEFWNNKGRGGSAIYSTDSNVILENSLFADNIVLQAGYDYGAIVNFVGTGSSTITNCTFGNNVAPTRGAALYVAQASTVAVRNSVFWGNTVADSRTPAAEVAIASRGALSLFNNCLQGATSTTNGNFTLDPIFVDPVHGNFQTARISPLRTGVGNYVTISDKDLLGVGRGGDPDIGAYQATNGALIGAPVLSLPAAGVSVKTTGGGVASFSYKIPSGAPTTFTWQVNTGGGWADVSNGGRYEIVTDGSGSTLTITGLSATDNGLQARIVNSNYFYTSPGSVLTVVTPTIIYVNQLATGAKNGSTWPNAYTDLTAALKIANENNEIWVAKGTYVPTDLRFTMPQNVEVYGGFVGGETLRTARNATANPTILRPSGNPAILSCDFNENLGEEKLSLFDGFIFENASSSGAVFIRQRKPVFQNCVFRNNAVSILSSYDNSTFINCVFSNGTGPALKGGYGSGGTFTGCTFKDSTLAAGTGDALITLDYSSLARFTDSVFTNNSGGSGCIRAANATTLTVDRCQFLDNTGSSVGVMFLSTGSTVSVLDSLFVRNSAGYSGGAIHNRSGNLAVKNSTFVDNIGYYAGGAIENYGSGAIAKVINSIFWGNRVVQQGNGLSVQDQQVVDNSGGGGLTVANSVIEELGSLSGSGNSKYYPLFVDVDAGNYRLLSNSPAINAGQRTAGAGSKDLGLQPRFSGNAQDIGAYEFQGTRTDIAYLTQVARSATVPVLSQTSFTFAGYNFTWQKFDEATQTWIPLPTSPDYQLTSTGTSSTLIFPSTTLPLSGSKFRVVLSGGFISPTVTLTVKPPQIFHVNGGVAASGDGKSWGAAFKTIQEAVTASIAISSNQSSEIWVKTGTYAVAPTKPLNLSWPIQLYGGFVGNEATRDARDWVNNVTTLTSGGNGTILEDTGANYRGYGSSMLDGFTISNAATAGYYIYQSAPTIRNCTFTGGNSGVDASQYSRATFQGCTFQNLTGPAIRIYADQATIDNCLFKDNTSEQQGIVVVSGGKCAITKSRFEGNITNNALLDYTHNTATTVTISRTKFTGNTSRYALISLYPKTSLTMDNSLLAKNTVTGGSVVASEGPTVKIDYCTIADNRHQGSAVGVSRDAQTTVRYSILWGNRNTLALAERLQQGVTDVTKEQACILRTFAASATLTVYRGVLEGVEERYVNENEGANPLFVNPDAGDYSLSSNSKAIGHGSSEDAALYGTLDLAGAPRRYPSSGGLPDVGAYEFQAAPSASLQIFGDYGSRRVIVGTTTSFTLFAPADPVQWQVDRNDGQGFVNLIHGGDVDIKPTNLYHLTLSNVTLAMSGYKYRFVISGGHPYTSPASTLTVVSKPVRYVNAAATGTGDGTSWTNAYPKLSTAISDVYISNYNGNPEITAEIWVAKGTYAGGGELSRGMEIYGGFVGGEATRNLRDSAANETTVTSEDYIFTYTDKPDSLYGDPVIDGLTLSLPSGFILSKDDGSISVVNCKFLGAPLDSNGDFPTKGIYSQGGTTLVKGSTFTRTGAPILSRAGAIETVQNCVFENGGPVDVAGSTISIEDSTFRNNADVSLRAGNYESGATVNIARSKFLNNVNPGGPGAISNSKGTMKIRQSLFAGNSGKDAGAITNHYNGTLQLFGVTIADNVVFSTDYAGAIYQDGDYLSVDNSILWNNTATVSHGTTLPQQIVRRSGQLINAGSAIQVASFTPGVGISRYSYDPRFVGGGDYHLSSSSPYIGVGQTGTYYVPNGETDLDGNSRLTAGKVDFGAYENGVSTNPIYATQPADAARQAIGGDIVLSIGGSTAGNFVWQFSDDGGATWKNISELPSGVAHSQTTDASAGGITLYTITLGSVPISLSGYQFRISTGGFATVPTTVTVVQPETIYVRANAPAGGNGTSWATAYNTLDRAISAVTVMRRIIHVAAGTYYPNNGFNISKRMEIYGGFPADGGDLNSRDTVNHPTILSGAIPNSSSRVATVLSLYGGEPESNSTPVLQSDTVVDGLTIQDGRTGLQGIRANPVLRDLIIKNNVEQGMYFYRVGGLIEQCQILGNTGYGGAGAYFSDCEARVTRCVFQGNIASYYGGGLAVSNSGRRFPTPMTMDHLLVSGNAASEGGGIDVSNCSVTFNSSVITGNWAGTGGASGVSSERSTTTIRNSIIWGNRSSAAGTIEDQQLHLAPYSGGQIYAYSCDIEGVKNFRDYNLNPAVDPLFLSGVEASSAGSVGGDFRLNSASPLINAGNDSFATGYTVDLAGAPRRYQDGTVDIGAYEYQDVPDAPLVITEQPTDLVFAGGGTNEFRVRLADTAFTYQWESSQNGSAFTDVVDGAEFSGAQTNTLTLLEGNPTREGTLFRCKVTANSGGSARSLSAKLTVYPARYYVNEQAADDTGDGFTWATAMKTLPRAFSTLRINPTTGVEIWVAKGTYATTTGDDANATFLLKNKVELYGGFAGNETDATARDIAANLTVLNGLNNSAAVVSSAAGATTRVDGVSITTGLSGITNAGGVTMTVANSTFSGLAKGIVNTVGPTPTAVSASGKVTVQNCRFEGITGVGIEAIGIASLGDGAITVFDSIFTGNAQGISATTAIVQIFRSEFRGNGSLTVNGGGVALLRTPASKVENSLFSGNRGARGAGLYVLGGGVTARNCTFAGNYSDFEGAGLYFTNVAANGYVGGALDLYNSIVWDNSSVHSGNSVTGQVFLSSSNRALNNDVQNAPLNSGVIQAVNGNLSVAPTFVQPIDPADAPTTAGDFRLFSLSKIIDRGSNAELGGATTDLAKLPRSYGAAVDPGAYEFQADTLQITSQPGDATAGLGVRATFSVGVNAATASYQWQQSTDGGTTFNDLSESADFQGATAATLSVAGQSAYEGLKFRVHVTTTQPGDATSNFATYHYSAITLQTGLALRNATLTGATSSAGFEVPGGALETSIVDGSFAVHGSQTGRMTLANGLLTGVTVTGNSVSVQTATPFKAGELVEVTTNSGVKRADGFGANPLVYQFTAGASSRYGIFAEAEAAGTVPAGATSSAIGDLNGDGFVDLVVGGANGADVLFNDGLAAFPATAQTLGTGAVSKVALGSLGFTSLLDVVLVKADGSVEIWRNNGDNTFVLAATIPSLAAKAVALADFNADGALDLFIATTGASQVWLNDGSGTFVDSTQRLGTIAGSDVAVGDLDNDNDLDVCVASGTQDARVWLNNGTGNFSAAATSPNSAADRVALVDLNRDGKLDFVSVRANRNNVFLAGAGNGTFFNAVNLTGIGGGAVSAFGVGDFNGDGLPDFVNGATTLWKNTGPDGAGRFTFQPWQEQPALAVSGSLQIADLDGDRRLDLVYANADGTIQKARYRVVDKSLLQNGTATFGATEFGVIRGGTLGSVRVDSLPAHGTLTQAGTPVTAGQEIPAGSLDLAFEPIHNFRGFDTFAWTGSTDGTIYDATASEFNLGVQYVPQGLAPQPDALTVVQGGSTSVLEGGATSVLANEDNGDPLTATVLVPPTQGTLGLNTNGTFTYTHNGSELPRVDQFTYQVTDTASGEKASVVVSITVTNRNDAPSELTFTDAKAYEKSDLATSLGTFTVSDPDAEFYPAPAATLSLVAGANDNDQFKIAGTTLLAAAPLNYADGSTRTIRVMATDPDGLTLERTFTVSLKSRPVATPLTATVAENGDVDITLSGSNADGRPLTTFAIAGQPGHGRVFFGTGPNGVYVPNASFWGADSFTYTVSDGTVNSEPATVSVTITHVNHPPTLTTAPLQATENEPLNFTLTGSDPDNDPLTFTAICTSSKGVVTGDSPNFVFTPNPDQFGDFQLFVTIDDGSGVQGGIYLNGTIAEVAYLPIARDQSTTTAQNTAVPITLQGADRNGKSISFGVITAPSHGRLSGVAPNLVYTPDRNFHDTDSFQFRTTSTVGNSDPATVSINVYHVNQPPEAAGQSVATNQTQPVAITLGSGDPDGDPLTYLITRGPQHGTLTGDGADRVYTPTGIYSGDDSFEFSVSDGGFTVTAVVNITLNEVDLAPIADSRTISGHANIASTFALTGSDPKGLPITFEITTQPAHGKLTGSVPGSVTYTPDQKFVGTDSFTFKTNNGTLDSTEATVTINLPKDLLTAPVLERDFVENVYLGDTITIHPLANDSDFYGDSLTIISITPPITGSATISEDGKSLVYTATGVTAPGYDVIHYTVSNGSPYTSESIVFVQVLNQNLVVTSSADSGPGTLRAAIETIESSSRPHADWNVTFSVGITGQTIHLSTRDADEPDSALRITGNVNISSALNPIPVIQVDSSDGPMRAFHVMPGGILKLRGVTIQGGLALRGGAILNEGSLTIDDTRLTANTAIADGPNPGLGGAIYNQSATLNKTATLRLINATLTANVADIGGGFYQLGDGAPASTIIETATLSSHGTAGDFFSTAINNGTASIDATALTTESPTAPWFGALPTSVTIAKQFLAKLPVLVDGDDFVLSATSSNPAMSNVGWTGRGTNRTLKLSGFTPVNGAWTRLTATASNGSVSYVQHTDVTVDTVSHRAPVAVNDSAAITTSSSVLIPVIANDYDPDGGLLRIVDWTQPASGGSIAVEGNKIRFTHDGSFDGVFYSFTYTVENDWGDRSTATVSLRRVQNPLLVIYGADSGEYTLRAALDIANQYYNPDGWTIEIRPNFDGGTLLVPTSVGDRGVGDSAFLVTGHVTIDGSAKPGFTIQRDADGPAMRLFRVTETGNLTLKNVVLDGGVGKHGGVVLNEGTMLLDHATIENGSAVVGGGVFNEGSLTLDTTSLTQNAASSLGGALYNRNGFASLKASSLTANTALDGAGIHLFGSDDYSLVQLVDTTVNNAGATHDLSAAVTGTGTTALTAAGTTTVTAPGDTWVNPIADQAIDGTGSVPFTFTVPVSTTISAESQNEIVVPQGNLTISDLTSNSATLQVTPRSNGLAEVAVLATKGAISFGQIVKLTLSGALNEPPVPTNDSVTLFKGAQKTIAVLANDTDPEGATLSIQSVGTPSHGTATISGTSVIYTHDASETTTDAFTYVVSDGFGGTATGTVNVTVQDTVRTVTSVSNGGGLGTFREAMEFAAANPTSAPWRIVFSSAIPAGSIIQYQNYGPAKNGYTMFLITSRVLLDGSQVPRHASGAPGLTLRNDGGTSGPPQRFFYVAEGASLEIRSMILQDGRVQLSGGPDEGKIGGGGAVLNDGTFTATDVTFLGNSATGAVRPGGAISSSGTLTLTDCRFTANLSNVAGAAIYALGNASHSEVNIVNSTFTAGSSSASQVTLATSNGGTVTRNGSRNTLPAGEVAPWIASSAATTDISSPVDIPVMLGVPSDAYSVSASASPSARVASIQLTGEDASRTLSVSPASGAFGPVDLKVSLVNGPITVNETFVGLIVPPTPAAPSDLTAAAVSDSQIRLSWTDNATTETNYSVERSANGTDDWTVVADTLAANSTSYIDGGLDPTTTYYYRVRCDIGGFASTYAATANATTVASIGDGLPGWWRYQYFGDGTSTVTGSEPGTDLDGDGWSNLREYLAGTDPTKSASVFAAKLTRDGGDAVVSFDAISGKTYRIETTDSLTAPVTWTPMTSNIAGTAGEMTRRDTAAGVYAKRFYRVSIQPVSGPSVTSTDPVGFNTVNCLSNSDTFTGIPFTRAPEFVGTVASVTGNTLTLRGTPNFAVDKFVRVAGSQPKTYYVQIGSHASVNPNEGRIYPITGNAAGSITIDPKGQTVSGIAAGTPISIVPYWTLSTLFPSANANIAFTPSTSGFALKTQILIPDHLTDGVNLAPNVVYYYLSSGTNVGWRKFGDPATTDHSDDILIPDGYIIVRNGNNAPQKSAVLAGSVSTGKTAIPLSTSASSEQDNFVSLPQPVDATLNTLGLSPDDGSFAASASGFSLKDQVFVFDNSTGVVNRAPSALYFYISSGTNVGWRKVGDAITADHGSDVIPAGSALIIRKAKTASGATDFWTSSPN